MSKREIFFGGSYKMCDIIYVETDKFGGITGKYMIVRDNDGHEHIARKANGCWAAFSTFDLVSKLKFLDELTDGRTPSQQVT